MKNHFSRSTTDTSVAMKNRPMTTNNSGIALITALLASLLVLSMLLLVSALVIKDSRVTANDGEATRLALMADGASDVARLQVLRTYKNSQMSLNSWLDAVASCRDQPACTPLSGTVISDVQALQGKHLRNSGAYKLTWAVTNVSPTGNNAWVRIAATATSPSGGQQTVLRRVVMGTNNIFELAMLSEDTNCIYCHLKVNGDVGNYNNFRPGWGTEGGNGKNSGSGSSVDGNVYAASTTSADFSSATTINGLSINGKINTNYAGPKLPKDKSGTPAFPGLDIAMAKKSAVGSLSGGVIKTVPIGGTYTSAATASKIDKVFTGNVVLTGTKTNPIVLDKDIFVTGDVVIQGYITGRGAIYAGRNMYVAGNLENINKADKPGVGVCAGQTSLDECAKLNIAAKKDETRLAAGNNIVLGDYTEKDSANNALPVDDLQAGPFMREQFGLGVGSKVRYIQKSTSLELRKIGSKYVDGTGKEIPTTDIMEYGGSGKDPFVPLLKPGTTSSSGFSSWMSDSQYASILGTETMSNTIWRYAFSGSASESTMAAELRRAGLPTCGKSCSPAAADTAEGMAINLATGKSSNITYNGKDVNGDTVTGAILIQGRTIKVMVDQPRTFAKETTRLDAFLYANSRVAGRVGRRGGHINGGLIAREIGILATGLNSYESAWKNVAANKDKYNVCDTSTSTKLQALIAQGVTTEDAEVDNVNKECDFTINYDHRLRTGGYGFNLIKGAAGATTQWQLDVNGEHTVQP